MFIESNRRLQESAQILLMAKQELEENNEELEEARQREKHRKEELQRELYDKAIMENRLKILATRLEGSNRDLQTSKASFHNIVERSVDGIIIVDVKGVVRFLNKSSETIFGKKREDCLGRLFGLPVVAGEVIEVDIISSGAKPGVGEMCVVETEWEGETAYLLMIRDITERKQAEENQERLT
jgi:PAS domain-containing protein